LTQSQIDLLTNHERRIGAEPLYEQGDGTLHDHLLRHQTTTQQSLYRRADALDTTISRGETLSKVISPGISELSEENPWDGVMSPAESRGGDFPIEKQ
jgi:hypothetical protein